MKEPGNVGFVGIQRIVTEPWRCSPATMATVLTAAPILSLSAQAASWSALCDAYRDVQFKDPTPLQHSSLSLTVS